MKLLSNVLAFAIGLSLPAFGRAQPGECTDCKDCTCTPDPHFKTWNDDYYDYHGTCDGLYLVKSDLLDLIIKTQLSTFGSYSYVEEATLTIGSDTVVIDENGDITSPVVPPTTIGGYPLTTTSTGSQTVHEVTLDNAQFVRITSWDGSTESGLSIHVRGNEDDFDDADGMCGTWLGGTTPDADDHIATGSCIDPPGSACCCLCPGEMVEGCPTPTEPTLCHDNPDQDNGCNGACISADTVEDECADVADEMKANCHFDVATTGDVMWAKAPFYQDPLPPTGLTFCAAKLTRRGKNRCQAMGGECQFNCVTTEEFRCIPGLCDETKDSPFSDENGRDHCACQIQS